jgi:lipoate-protein ligase A
MQIWRLIDSGVLDGSENMAIDEAILEAHMRGMTPPTLRFYRWKSPTLSVGYAQSYSPEEILACEKAGVSWVRRPTGGRAVFHGDELTYSVVVSADYGVSGSIQGTYRQISQALVTGLQLLGVEAALKPGSQKGASGRACFAATTQADLGYREHKLVGSAQLRRGGCLLQHGSIPRHLDRAFHEGFLGPSHATSLEEVLGYLPTWEQSILALREGFERYFGVVLVSCELLDCERRLVRELRPKYLRPRLIQSQGPQ